MKGLLIAVEGIDYAGKSTLIQHLVKNFQFASFRFPDRTTIIGKTIDKILKNDINLNEKALQLLFSANRWELVEEINDTLKEGTNVLLDRYIYSGIVYGRENYCSGADKNLPEPDFVFFLNIDPKQVLKRMERHESELFENMNEQYLAYAEYLKIKDDNWIEIDATKSIEDVIMEFQQHFSRLKESYLV